MSFFRRLRDFFRARKPLKIEPYKGSVDGPGTYVRLSPRDTAISNNCPIFTQTGIDETRKGARLGILAVSTPLPEGTAKALAELEAQAEHKHELALAGCPKNASCEWSHGWCPYADRAELVKRMLKEAKESSGQSR